MTTITEARVARLRRRIERELLTTLHRELFAAFEAAVREDERERLRAVIAEFIEKEEDRR